MGGFAMKLNNEFLWGSATASYQCEGAWQEDDKVESNWDKYLHDNHYENGDVASDFYHHYKEDIAMLKKSGQNAFRFSFSWTRIIGEDGSKNQKGLDFYHSVIDECLKYGIEPFVTLYHWDLPQYLEDNGGWLNRKTCEAYREYAKTCFKEFNGKIKYWTTFNEPKWTIVSGYLVGNYPPAIQNPEKTVKAGYHMMLASAMAIREFRELQIQGTIGIVHSYSPVNGVDDSSATNRAMRYADNFMNNWVLDTAAKGKIPTDFLQALSQKGINLSFIDEDDI